MDHNGWKSGKSNYQSIIVKDNQESLGSRFRSQIDLDSISETPRRTADVGSGQTTMSTLCIRSAGIEAEGRVPCRFLKYCFALEL